MFIRIGEKNQRIEKLNGKKKGGIRVKILHLSDIHYRISYPKTNESYKTFLPHMTSPEIFLEMVSKVITEEKIDLIITSGDLTDDGNLEDYLKLKKLFEQYFNGIPHIIGLGNHDHHDNFYNAFNYLENRGQVDFFNHVVDYKGLRVVVFDNTFKGSPNGAFEPSQLVWLNQTLKDSKAYRVILVMHHHLLDIKNQVPAVKETIDFSKIIEDSSVVAIICGHAHHAYEGLYMNKPYALAPSLSFRGVVEKETGDVRFEEYPGYQVIHVTEDQLSFKNYYLLDEPKVLGKIKIKKGCKETKS
jgi:3',5'-cyclic-AMP phosphodiesterase